MILFFKHSNTKLSLFFALFSLCQVATAQQIYSNNQYPLTDFRQPLDINPPALSGSFGEIRSNHFHSGVDFRTNQREGYPVYAVGDGYISRFRVQNSGFGQALYVTHPNGFTTVYGHLQRFSPKIARVVKITQYNGKTFQVDEFPEQTAIPVRKGEVIGWSGNRGSSGGPHLHFEVRDTKTEETINPQFFGINIPDNIPPVIHSLYAYRLNGNAFDENTPKQALPITGSNGSYKAVSTTSLAGEIGFGVITTDRHNGNSGTNGVYSIQLEVDGKIIFTSALERFSFENSKAINSHLDYPNYIKTRRSIQKSFVDPGNPLRIYSGVVNNGRINFNDGKTHQLRYLITDAKGNQSTLNFSISDALSQNQASPAVGTIYAYNKSNQFKNEDVEVNLPQGTLYNDLNFTYKKLPRPAGNAWSAKHQIHNNLTPLHHGFELLIRPINLPEGLQSKALIVNANGSNQGGVFENGLVKSSPKTFGTFYIAVDTIPPRITPTNIAEGKSMRGLSKMIFKIGDNLSGIKSFNGYIDGNWVLMEFDAKTATLWHSFDERTGTGKHAFELVVTDMKDNTKTFNLSFFR